MSTLDDKDRPDAPGEDPVDTGAYGRALFEGMGDACAFCRMIYQDGAPVDWVYLAVNPAFESMTGLKDVVGRRITELIPGVRDTAPDVFELYERVTHTGQAEEGEFFLSPLNFWARLQVFRPGPGQFAVVFKDVTAHRQAREAARSNEQRFRMLFELAPDPTSLSGPDGTLLMVNQAWCDITGVPREEAVGRNPAALGAWSKSGERQNLFAELDRTGMSVTRESMLRRRDGGERQMLVTAKRLAIEEAGEVLIVGKDVTEFQELSEALGQRTRELQRSESRFRLMFEKAPLGLAIVDSTSGRFLSVNARLGEIVGLGPEALLETTYQSVTHPDHVADDLRSVQELISGAVAEVQKEKRCLHSSGRTVWVRLRMVRLPTLPGEPPWHLSLVEDITEARDAMERLRQSEARFRRLIADLPAGVMIHSSRDEVLFCNRKALGILALPESQLLGRSAWAPDLKLIHEDGSPFSEPSRPSRLAAATGEPVRDVVMGVSHAGTKGPIWVSVNAEPQLDEAGEVRQVICTFLDITPRKAAEAEQVQMQRRLQQSQKMESLGILVAGVAHTMNNVLAVIMGTASWREPSTNDPADREAYQRIARACDRGRDVVKSLMQFSRPTLSAPAPFELGALVREVCPLVENASRGHVLIVAAGEGEPLWVQGDAGSVKLALVNLCFNALEAMPEGGTLTLRCAGHGADWAEVAVQDDGRGMAPEVLAHAAEPFFTTKDDSSGAGLGLAMVYGVTAAHGGTMGITSQPGLGTTVVLQFPRIQPPLPAQAGRGPAPALRLGKVLLVDDEEDVRFLMQRMLRKAGVGRVETAAGGEAALACLAKGDLPDVIILDQNMPGMTGAQFLARLRESHPDLPVLISSGQPDIEEWPDFQGPRVAVISKPFTLQEIQTRLEAFARELGIPD